MLAAGVLDLAGRPKHPMEEANPKTERYVKRLEGLETMKRRISLSHRFLFAVSGALPLAASIAAVATACCKTGHSCCRRHAPEQSSAPALTAARECPEGAGSARCILRLSCLRRQASAVFEPVAPSKTDSPLNPTARSCFLELSLPAPSSTGHLNFFQTAVDCFGGGFPLRRNALWSHLRPH